MKFWNQFLIWLGISFIEIPPSEEEKHFHVNRNYDPTLWKKNKMKE